MVHSEKEAAEILDPANTSTPAPDYRGATFEEPGRDWLTRHREREADVAFMLHMQELSDLLGGVLFAAVAIAARSFAAYLGA